MMKAILTNILCLRAKSPEAQDAGPLGNLAARQAGRPKSQPVLHGHLKRELRSYRDLRGKGSKQEATNTWAWLLLIYMNLDFFIQ